MASEIPTEQQLVTRLKAVGVISTGSIGAGSAGEGGVHRPDGEGATELFPIAEKMASDGELSAVALEVLGIALRNHGAWNAPRDEKEDFDHRAAAAFKLCFAKAQEEALPVYIAPEAGGRFELTQVGIAFELGELLVRARPPFELDTAEAMFQFAWDNVSGWDAQLRYRGRVFSVQKEWESAADALLECLERIDQVPASPEIDLERDQLREDVAKYLRLAAKVDRKNGDLEKAKDKALRIRELDEKRDTDPKWLQALMDEPT